MTFMSGLMKFLAGFWSLFLVWLSLFAAPFKNTQLLWIIIPIWLAWFFSEFFQEKKGTSFGNAVSNGVVPIWVTVDWSRFLIEEISASHLKFSFSLFMKFFLCLLVLVYGLVIIIQGIKAKKFIRYFGRIREVTYVLVMFTPLIYGVVETSWTAILAIIVFFPLFYFLIEMIDHLTPNSPALEEDAGGERSAFDLGSSSDNALNGLGNNSTQDDPFKNLDLGNNDFSAQKPRSPRF